MLVDGKNFRFVPRIVAFEYLEFLMDKLAIFVPRLDFFAKTEWLVYGMENSHELRLLLLQALLLSSHTVG